MSLTANRELNRYVDQELRSFGVKAAEHIWKGSIVGIDRATGYARKLVAGDVFAGIAYEEIDNSAGAGGDQMIRLYTQGDFILPVTGATQTLVGAAVYATDEETTTLTPSAGASFCGVLLDVSATNKGVVRIEPTAAGQIEHVVSVPLASLTSGATSNAVLITQRAIKVVSIQVSFNTKPDAGTLDVGTDNSDPDELVDAFNLTTLTNHTPATMTLAGRDVAKNIRVWAKISAASSTAGVGGMLTMRYVELP